MEDSSGSSVSNQLAVLLKELEAYGISPQDLDISDQSHKLETTDSISPTGIADVKDENSQIQKSSSVVSVSSKEPSIPSNYRPSENSPRAKNVHVKRSEGHVEISKSFSSEDEIERRYEESDRSKINNTTQSVNVNYVTENDSTKSSQIPSESVHPTPSVVSRSAKLKPKAISNALDMEFGDNKTSEASKKLETTPHSKVLEDSQDTAIGKTASDMHEMDDSQRGTGRVSQDARHHQSNPPSSRDPYSSHALPAVAPPSDYWHEEHGRSHHDHHQTQSKETDYGARERKENVDSLLEIHSGSTYAPPAQSSLDPDWDLEMEFSLPSNHPLGKGNRTPRKVLGDSKDTSGGHSKSRPVTPHRNQPSTAGTRIPAVAPAPKAKERNGGQTPRKTITVDTAAASTSVASDSLQEPSPQSHNFRTPERPRTAVRKVSLIPRQSYDEKSGLFGISDQEMREERRAFNEAREAIKRKEKEDELQALQAKVTNNSVFGQAPPDPSRAPTPHRRRSGDGESMAESRMSTDPHQSPSRMRGPSQARNNAWDADSEMSPRSSTRSSERPRTRSRSLREDQQTYDEKTGLFGIDEKTIREERRAFNEAREAIKRKEKEDELQALQAKAKNNSVFGHAPATALGGDGDSGSGERPRTGRKTPKKPKDWDLQMEFSLPPDHPLERPKSGGRPLKDHEKYNPEKGIFSDNERVLREERRAFNEAREAIKRKEKEDELQALQAKVANNSVFGQAPPDPSRAPTPHRRRSGEGASMAESSESERSATPHRLRPQTPSRKVSNQEQESVATSNQSPDRDRGSKTPSRLRPLAGVLGVDQAALREEQRAWREAVAAQKRKEKEDMLRELSARVQKEAVFGHPPPDPVPSRPFTPKRPSTGHRPSGIPILRGTTTNGESASSPEEQAYMVV